MNASLSVIYPNLHVIVSNAIYQQSFYVKQIRELGEFKESVEFDGLVDLRDLADETDKSDVLQRLYVLLEDGVFLGLESLNDRMDARA